MLPVVRAGSRGPLLVMLHWLGGSAQTWTEVSHGLAHHGVRCAAVDLPGFGEAASIAGYDVQSMAQGVIETVRSLRAEIPGPWLLVGHSMGGRVADVVARAALDGAAGLDDLRGLVLVSPSTPSPEPMSDDKRSSMLKNLGESTGDAAIDRKRAAGFVDDNTGKVPLPEAVRDRAIAGVLRMNRTAFRRWLEAGSNEDWSTRVGTLPLPALILAGTEDSALGPDAQKQLTLPHFPEGQLITLDGAGHLAPLERPGEVVQRTLQFLAQLKLSLPVTKAAPAAAFADFVASDHVSPRTREVMQARLQQAGSWNDATTQLQVFSPEEFLTLRALTERIIPDAGFDLAASIDRELASSPGDGWRFADLPQDAAAWHRGLASLDAAAQRAKGVPFLALSPHAQDALLEQATSGDLGRGLLGSLHLGAAAQAFSAHALQQWFEDVRAMCTRFYIGDPRTMERIGYTGFADDLGFTQIRLGEREEFER